MTTGLSGNSEWVALAVLAISVTVAFAARAIIVRLTSRRAPRNPKYSRSTVRNRGALDHSNQELEERACCNAQQRLRRC